MFGSPLGMALGMAVMAGGATGSFYVYENHQEIAEALRGEAERAIDNVTDQFATPAFRYLDAHASTSSDTLVGIDFTLQVREGAEVQPADAWVNVTTDGVSRLLSQEESSLTFEPVRDPDGSAARALFNDGDLLLVRIPLGELGIDVGPRESFTIAFETPAAPPLVLEVDTPSFFTDGKADLDVRLK